MSHEITIRDTNIRITFVLELIAQGLTYEQILKKQPVLNMTDLMTAAKVAAELIKKVVDVTQDVSVGGKVEFTARLGQFRTLDELRKDIPRAFEKWTTAEENDMVACFKKGDSIPEIAGKLQRSRGSIRARLIKLGLMEDTAANARRQPQAAQPAPAGNQSG